MDVTLPIAHGDPLQILTFVFAYWGIVLSGVASMPLVFYARWRRLGICLGCVSVAAAVLALAFAPTGVSRSSEFVPLYAGAFCGLHGIVLGFWRPRRN